MPSSKRWRGRRPLYETSECCSLEKDLDWLFLKPSGRKIMPGVRSFREAASRETVVLRAPQGYKNTEKLRNQFFISVFYEHLFTNYWDMKCLLTFIYMLVNIKLKKIILEAITLTVHLNNISGVKAHRIT